MKLIPERVNPLFGKWFDNAHHPELVKGEELGDIFKRCLLNYGPF